MSICSPVREVGCKQVVAADPFTSCCMCVVGIKQSIAEEQPGPGC